MRYLCTYSIRKVTFQNKHSYLSNCHARIVCTLMNFLNGSPSLHMIFEYYKTMQSIPVEKFIAERLCYFIK